MALLTQPDQPGSLMQVREGQMTHKCHENPKARVQHSGPCCKETLKCHVCMENRAPWGLSHNRISCCRGGCEGNKSMACLQISWRFQWNNPFISSEAPYIYAPGIPADAICYWHPQGRTHCLCSHSVLATLWLPHHLRSLPVPELTQPFTHPGWLTNGASHGFLSSNKGNSIATVEAIPIGY